MVNLKIMQGEPIVTLIDLNLAEVGASPQQMEWEMEDVNRILDSLVRLP